jgi:uncharacterized protein YgiM (DUF1202 family)
MWRLCAISCVLIMMCVACNPQVATTPTPGETSSPVAVRTAPQPTDTLQIVVTPIIALNIPTITPPCAGRPATRLIIGEAGQVNEEDMRPLNIRSGPSTDFRTVGRLEVREVFNVLGGPECGGDYVWYRIRRQDGVEGWIAEGEPGLYYVEPFLPG